MSKCNECKYEHLSKSEHPCSVCRWKAKERVLAFVGKLNYFEPKEEQPTTEYNGCRDCYYELLDESDAPCCECKHQFAPGTDARLKAKDCFRPKELKVYDEVDMVNHPAHYNRDGAMECIDEMITVFGKDIVACFCLCNVWKYRYRASDKGHEEDLSKSDYYMAKYKELITERSVLGFESVMEREELEDIVKEKLDKLYTEREIKKHDK
jgi:hypothetical protein